jgi:hypothetical protein
MAPLEPTKAGVRSEATHAAVPGAGVVEVVLGEPAVVVPVTGVVPPPFVPEAGWRWCEAGSFEAVLVDPPQPATASASSAPMTLDVLKLIWS